MNKLKHLQPRDYEIFKTIDSYGFLSTSQVHRLIFGGISRRTVLRRLQALWKKNFLKSHFGLPNGEKIWCLLSDTAKMIGSEFSLKSLNKNTLVHDIRLNDIRIDLEAKGLAKHWSNGHLLTQKAYEGVSPRERYNTVIPDGIMLLNLNSGAASSAIELELILKAKNRYKKIFSDYSKKTQIQILWYVVPTKKMGAKLLSFLPEESIHRKSEWVYWSLLREVLKNPDEVILKGRKDEKFFKRPLGFDSVTGKQFFKEDEKLKKICSPSPAHTDAHAVSNLKLYDDL